MRKLTYAGLGGLGELPRRLRALRAARAAVAVGDGGSGSARGGAHLAAGAAAGRAQRGDGPLDAARAQASDLLAEIERLRPGLAHHRSLDVGFHSGALAQALCESFDACDAVSPRADAVAGATRANLHPERCRYQYLDAGAKLPFAEESFDLVHCGVRSDALRGERLEQTIAEMLRVLRLHGVGVIDHAVAAPEGAPEPAPESPQLDIRVSGLDGLSPVAGKSCELTVTVTNAGASILGSAIDPLRLECRWNPHRGVAGPEASVELDRVLFPAESSRATFSLAVPPMAGAHLLELWVAGRSPWGPRASRPAYAVVDVSRSARAGDRRAIASVEFGADEAIALAVARAEGVILAARSAQRPGAALTRYVFARF